MHRGSHWSGIWNTDSMLLGVRPYTLLASKEGNSQKRYDTFVSHIYI